MSPATDVNLDSVTTYMPLAVDRNLWDFANFCGRFDEILWDFYENHIQAYLSKLKAIILMD